MPFTYVLWLLSSCAVPVTICSDDSVTLFISKPCHALVILQFMANVCVYMMHIYMYATSGVYCHWSCNVMELYTCLHKCLSCKHVNGNLVWSQLPTIASWP